MTGVAIEPLYKWVQVGVSCVPGQGAAALLHSPCPCRLALSLLAEAVEPLGGVVAVGRAAHAGAHGLARIRVE